MEKELTLVNDCATACHLFSNVESSNENLENKISCGKYHLV